MSRPDDDPTLDPSPYPTPQPGPFPTEDRLDLRPVTESVGTRIGPYELLQQLGEGGMGVVWVAEQEQPVKRRVALKVIKPGMDSAQVIRRFSAERQALALMDHTSIAKVLDAGTTPDGRPYFVMELVKGVPITKYCDELNLPLRERLGLFVPVCQAIQHAHQKGIVHRDIKPSNVLIAIQDGKPVPKVIDFGVAKALHQRLTDRTMYTEIGAIIGTLEYMSPEQAELSALDIDTRADVYALGVLLYELLTGTTPLDRSRLRQAAFEEMLRIIREVEPPKPSTRLVASKEALANLAARRRTDPARLTKEVRGELDWIVMKALEKDRTRRYETASGLSRDVEHYLADEPVEACPPSTLYRLRKFARKHRAVMATATAFVALLAAGALVSTWQAVKATKAEILAVHAREEEALQRQKAEEQRSKAEAAERQAKAALEAETRVRKQLRVALDSLTDDVVERLFARQPTLGETEKAFLRKVLTLYEEFPREQDQAADARALRATGYMKVASIQNTLGQETDAEAAFRTAETLLTKLKEEFPASTEYRLALWDARNSLAELLQNRGKTEEAETVLRNLVAEAETMLAGSPKDPGYNHTLGAALLNLGNFLMEQDRIDESASLYRRALSVLEPAATDAKARPRTKLYLSSCYNNLGSIARRRSDLGAAEGSLKRALEIRAQLAAEYPDEPEHRIYLANTHNNIGIIQRQRGDLEEAEGSFRNGLNLREQLVADSPGVPIYRQDLARTALMLGDLLLARNRSEAALAAYDRAIEAASVVHRQGNWPAILQDLQGAGRTGRARSLDQSQRFAEAVAEWDKALKLVAPSARGPLQLRRAASLARSGDYALATKIAEDVVQTKQGSGSPGAPILYDAACVFSLVSAQVRNNPEQTRHYTSRAVELLRQAWASGFNDFEHIKKDTDLDPVRQDEGYKKLIAELEAELKKRK
jgi:serine/threonine protein kinase/tetratricopeptide (TPR) repeat protein